MAPDSPAQARTAGLVAALERHSGDHANFPARTREVDPRPAIVATYAAARLVHHPGRRRLVVVLVATATVMVGAAVSSALLADARIVALYGSVYGLLVRLP